MTKKNDSTGRDILLSIILLGFCGVMIGLGTRTLNYPYWLVGALIGFSLLVLSLSEFDWKIRDWYTFVISAVTISLVILIAYWIGKAIDSQETVNVDIIISGLSAIATVLMVFYVAIQTHAVKESVEEMKTQRLIGIVLPASAMLLEIKDIVRGNEECLRGGGQCIGYKPWREGIFDQLGDLGTYLKKPELTFVTSLIPEPRLYRTLEEYHNTIISPKQTYSALSTVLNENPRISESLKTVMQTLCVHDGNKYSKLCVELAFVPVEHSQFEPEKITELKGVILYLLFYVYSGKELANEYYDEIIEKVRLKQLQESLPDQIDSFIDEIKKGYILREK